MNIWSARATHLAAWCVTTAALILLTGCSTSSTARYWDSRVGSYTWDDALAELGTPDRVDDLEGGVKSAEWLQGTRPSITTMPRPSEPPPEYTRADPLPQAATYGTEVPEPVLRLMFTPDGKLIDWDRSY